MILGVHVVRNMRVGQRRAVFVELSRNMVLELSFGLFMFRYQKSAKYKGRLLPVRTALHSGEVERQVSASPLCAPRLPDYIEAFRGLEHRRKRT